MIIKRIAYRFLKWLASTIAVVLLVVIAFAVMFEYSADKREHLDRTEAAPTTGRFVPAGDVEMYVQEWGPKTGRPVLLVHAAGGWSGVWQLTGEALAEKGFHVIAVDMPPLGYSQRPADNDYSRAAQAKRLLGVLDWLHIQKATLVGHSFGARAVAQLALTHPERVSSLVFVDAALSLQTSKSSSVLDTLMATHFIRRAITAATLSNPLFTKTLLDMFVADPASATPYWVGIYQKPLVVDGTTDATADWLPELLTVHDLSESSNPILYKSVKVPTLVIWGEADTVTPLSQGQYLASLIPHAQLKTLAGVGHLPPIEATDQFNDLLLTFLTTR